MVSEVINHYFIKKSGLYHYLNTAKSNYREYLKGDTVRLKKYFYVLRPILACKWIFNEQTPPPMLFSTLMEKYLDESIKPDVEKLLKIKTQMPEISEGARIDSINSYIDENLARLEQDIQQLPAEDSGGWDELDRIFRTLLNN